MKRIFECLSNRLAVLALGGAVIAAGSALAFTEKEGTESQKPSVSIPVDERPIAREFGGKWKMLRVEAFDLFDGCAGIFRKVEDVDLPLAENNPHADRRMAKRIDGMLLAGEGIGFEIGALQQLFELALDDFAGSDPVLVFR